MYKICSKILISICVLFALFLPSLSLGQVVTEATGVELQDWSLRADPDLTYSQIQSSTLTDIEWTATGTMTVAKDFTGLQGEANGGNTLTAGAANDTVIANAITAASATHTSRWYLWRKTGTGSVELTVDNGATWQDVTADFDTTGYSEVLIDQAAVTNPQIGIRIVTSGDAVYVGNASAFLAKSIADVRRTGPQFTTTAAKVTGSQDLTYDSGNISDTSGMISFKFEVQGADNLIGNFISHDGTNLKVDDGTTTDTVVAAVSTWHRGAVWWHGSEMALCLNGTCEAAVAYDGTMLSGDLDIARFAAHSVGIGDIKGYSGGDADSYNTQAEYDTQ